MKKAVLTLTMTAALLVLGMQVRAERTLMLEQGKCWCYTYHHFEDKEDGYHETTSVVFYILQGDTTIAGQQYMKMYRNDLSKNKYYGALREDKEGRVYLYNESEKKDDMLLDFSLHYDQNYFPNATPIEESIRVNNQLFTRYRYQNIRPDGSTYLLGYIAVEGVGFQKKGLVHYLFEPEPDCICDYEEFTYVEARDFYFDASGFQAPKEIPLTAEERKLVERNNDFAFNLFREARSDRSQVLSPLSITYALGMLNNGAAGQTQQEINQVLGFGDAEAMNNFCRKMLTESSDVDKNTKVMIGNTIFVNHGYELQEAFKEKANTFYDANPESRDFADGKTMDVINQWASDHTEGMIKEVLTPSTFNPDAASYLLNAIYFKGAWTSKFDPNMTRTESFKSGENVQMMHQNNRFEYAENDLYQAIRLPYGNEGYSMEVFLPQEGKSLEDLLVELDGANWKFKGMSYEVDLKLPRFETDTNIDLKPIMMALGMPSAFDHNNAEFPYFCNWPIFIDKMKQVAKIILDEEGTEAAAVTSIETNTWGELNQVVFHANRPFLYIISEQSTGAIFFIGQFMGNVTAGVSPPQSPQKGGSPVYDLQGRRMAENQPLHPGIYVKDGRKFVVK